MSEAACATALYMAVSVGVLYMGVSVVCAIALYMAVSVGRVI